MKLEFLPKNFRQIFICEISRNFIGGSRDFLRRRTDRRAEMTKLRVAFGNFTNTPKKRKKILDHYGVYV